MKNKLVFLTTSLVFGGLLLSATIGTNSLLANAAESDDWTIVSLDKNITKTSLSNGVSFTFGNAVWGARVRKLTSPDLTNGFAFDFNASNFIPNAGASRIGFYFSSNSNAYLPEGGLGGNLAAFTLVNSSNMAKQDRLGPGYPGHTLPPVDGISVDNCRSYTTADGNTKYGGPTGDGTVVFNHNSDNTASIHFAFKDAGNNRFSVTISPNDGYTAHEVQSTPVTVYMPGAYFNADSSTQTNMFVYAITDDSSSPTISITNFENLVNKHSVSFETNGGTAIQTRSIVDGQPVGEATTTRTGYTFGGWYSDSTFQNAWNVLTKPVTSELVLYAKWLENSYTVTFPQGTYCKETFTSTSSTGATKDPSGTSYPSNSTVYLFATLNDDSVQYAYAPQSNWTRLGSSRTYLVAQAVITAPITVDAFTAIRTTQKYDVTFNANGHGTAPSSQSIDYNGLVTKPTNPSETGYTFGGWYKEEACTNPWNFATDKITAATTLYAKWTINSYQVTFNANGHGVPPAAQSVNYNDLVIEPTDPATTGYTFGGWYKEEACTNPWNFATDKITAAITLYAKWTIKSYDVTFEMNGHGTAPQTQSVNYNGLVSKPTDPSATGYTFGGWYKDALFENTWDFANDVVTSATTLYAKWNSDKLLVTFNKMGHGTTPTVQEIEYNGLVTEPSMTETGYTFGGWYKEEGLINPWNFATDKVTAATTLYAKWTPNTYTLHFDGNGGEVALESKSVTFDQPYGTLTTATRAGYNFDGWFTDRTGGAAITAESVNSIAGNHTIYAHWNITQCTVSFNSNGHGIAPNNQTVDYGDIITKPDDLTETGYTFGGWYIDENLEYEYNFDDPVTQSLTLYAKWNANSYTLHFDAKGGECAQSSKPITYNSTYGPLPVPTKVGNSFVGWFTMEIGGSEINADSIVDVTNDITLYAHWEIGHYTVNFDANGGSVETTSKIVNYESTYGTLPTPTKTGYIFLGWYTEQPVGMGELITSETRVSKTQDHTLFAHWEENRYLVTFDVSGKGQAPDSQNVSQGDLLTRPVDPTADGFIFGGWYKDANYETAWDFSSDIVITDLTLYAKWDKITYTVTFFDQGSNKVILTNVVGANEKVAEPGTPTKEGFSFVGWYSDAELTNKFDFNNNVINSDATIYAKWKSKGGCSGEIGAVSGVSVLALGTIAVAIIKKRKIKK